MKELYPSKCTEIKDITIEYAHQYSQEIQKSFIMFSAIVPIPWRHNLNNYVSIICALFILCKVNQAMTIFSFDQSPKHFCFICSHLGNEQ